MRDCQACICLKCKHNIDLYFCELSHEYTCKGCEDYIGECADFKPINKELTPEVFAEWD